ncbi:MAG: GAF domain-containing protein [Anaerolineales bacterium]|jgi:GAF domain-containing protein
MDTGNPLRALQAEVNRLRDENQDLKDEIAILRASMDSLISLDVLIQSMKPDTDVLAMLDDVLASALNAVGASAGSLLLVDPEKDELAFAVVHGQARDRLTGFRMPISEGIAGWVATNKKSALVRDVQADPRFSPRVDVTFDFQTRSLACVPLMEDEKVIGVIEAVNKTYDRDFSDNDGNQLKVVAQLAVAAIRRAERLTEPEG